MALGTIFVSTLLLSFAFTLLIAGIFGAKFGQGRSRGIGVTLSLIAVVLIGVFAALTWPLVPGFPPVFNPEAVTQSIVAVLAATVGAIVAIVAFVASVMQA